MPTTVSKTAAFLLRLVIAGLLPLAAAPLVHAASGNSDQVIERSFDLTTRGQDSFSRGDYADAERLFREVLDLQLSANPQAPLSVASAMHNVAAVLAATGRLAEAEQLARQALALREQNGAVDNALVSSWRLLSSILNDLGQYGEARDLAARALDRTLNGADVDRSGLIRNAAALAYLKAEEGDLAGGIDLLNQLVPLLPDLPAADRARVLNAAGRLSSMSGDTANAEAFYRQAIATSADLPLSQDWTAADNATVRNNLGSLMLAQGRLGDAKALFDDAERILAAAGLTETALRANVLDGLGEVYRGQFLYQKAFDTQRQALDIRLRLFPGTHPSVGASFSNIGLTLLRAGQGEYAVASLEKAVAIQRENGDMLRLARAEANLAGAYLLVGRQPKAIDVMRDASLIYEQTLPKGHPDMVTAFFNEAWLNLGAGRNDVALERARAAFAMYRPNATRLGADETVGATATRDSRRQVLALVAALWETDRNNGIDEAFQAAQWAQSSAAGQVVRRVAARFAAGEGKIAELARRKQDLVNQWRATDRRYLARVSSGGASDAIAVSLQDQIAQIGAGIDGLDKQIEAEFPQYASLTLPSAVSLGEVQSLLRPDEALLMPVTTGDETYVFAVSAEKAQWARTDLQEQGLDTAVRALRADLDPTGPARSLKSRHALSGERGPSYDRQTAYNLYSKLIAPVSDVLDGKKAILAVQEGALAGLPLSVLVDAPPTGADDDPAALKATPWLARRFAVSTLPAVSSLRALRSYRNPRAPSVAFVGFGDPDFKGTGKEEPPVTVAGYFDRGLADGDALRSLPQLPGTRREVQGLAKLLGAPKDAVILGDDATEAAVKSSPMLRDAAIVTFATHGLVAGDITGLAEPALAFSTPATPSETDDGLLTASEAAELDLSAKWVILSACNTAAPDGTPGGEGLSGLASAFLYAGARSLLVSHWPVRDDAAPLLTQGAITAQEKDPSIGNAEAMRRSMLALIGNDRIANASHPSVWAPFAVVGAED